MNKQKKYDNKEKRWSIEADIEKIQLLELAYKDFKIITNNKLKKNIQIRLKYEIFQQKIL